MALLQTESLAALLLFLFWAWGIVDVIATDAPRMRHLDKVLWLIVVILVPVLGAVVWVVFGRQKGAGLAPGASNMASSTSRSDGRSKTRSNHPRFSGKSPYGPDSAPRYLGDMPISDRRSQQLDAQLDAQLARRKTERDKRDE